LFLGILQLTAQQDKEDVRESVKVVNIEVPVRVYHNGKPVENLTKADFQLYENRKRQDITGFILKRKKINVGEVSLTAKQEKSWKSRYFVLVFRITHYNDYIKKGLDHVFDNILKESDQLLVFVNDRTVAFENLKDKASAKSKLDQFLREGSLKVRHRMLNYLKKIETTLDKHKFEMSLSGNTGPSTNIHLLINDYLDKFLNIWKEYKQRYLFQDVNTYYNFSRYLKNISKEKWVINFYQFELFPDIMLNSRSMRQIRNYIGQWQAKTNYAEVVNFARIVSRQLNQIQTEMNVGKDFPAAEVAKIFHNVDATFHTIFMRTTISTMMEDVEYKQISTELENSLREITKRTGGELVLSNKLDVALDSICEKEDVYYILTYAPANPDKVGKIKIKTANKKHNLIYSPDLRSGYLAGYIADKEIKTKPLKINEFKFKNGKLSLAVSDFYWDKEKKGSLSIRIRIKDAQGNMVFDQKKNISPINNEIKINLDFSNMSKGKYDFVVDVEDQYTKKVATEFCKADIT
jgi:hypothetical protein